MKPGTARAARTRKWPGGAAGGGAGGSRWAPEAGLRGPGPVRLAVSEPLVALGGRGQLEGRSRNASL